MPPTLLYKLINNLKKMKEDSLAIKQRPSHALRGTTFTSSQSHQRSILLNKIKDQQNYLCLTNTLLRLAKEAGVPEDSLRLISQSMLAARGYQSNKMLVDANQPQESLKKKRETYNWLDRGISLGEEQVLLTKLERELVQARETESQYRCLVKYKSQKQDQIAPNTSSNPNSRKQRFKRMMKERMSVPTVQSSNFYEYEVQQILQNSFKYENQCYRTIGSFSHLKTMFGHASDSDIQSFSQIFNAIMDRSENLVITGGEQGLIKIWHKMSGTLITNLKGHTEFLNKIDTSKSNKYLLTTAGDGLRFFDLRTLKPLGGWRTESSIQEINSFIEKDRELFLFGDNSSLYILTEETLLSKTQERLEVEDFYQFYFGQMIGRDNSHILVISLSPHQTHLLLGLQSGQLMMVLVSDLLVAMEMNKVGQQLTLPCLLTVKAHSEQIIQVKWSNNSHLWATGAKDGRCCLWELKDDQIHLITTLTVGNKSNRGRRKKYNYTCTYICWNCTFSHFAAGFQENVEDEDNDRGHGEVLVYSLKERRVTSQLSRDVSQQYGGIRAMDAHPYYPNILLICQAQGNILLFDIFLGCVINVFQQRGYHILHPNFQLIPTQCRFSQDGLSFIVATQYGSVSIYGYDSKIFFSMTPTQQFLKTDFQPIKIQDNTMRALPLSLTFQEDINNYPRGEILNVRAQKQNNAISVNPESLIYQINQPLQIYSHFAQSKLDPTFLKIIANNIKDIETQEQIYSKTYDQIERIKQLVLFHQRQRQFLVVQSLINQKIRQLKATKQGLQKIEIQDESQPVARPKLKRLSQRNRVNYADDFEYDQSKEEDYDGAQDFNQQQIPEELPDSYFEGQEDQQEAPRIRRRQTRNRRITRVTRQSNNNSRIYNQEHNEDDFAEERVTRKRRRNITEQFDQLENEHQPKKKQKMEQESSQNRTYSRLRKHVNENENQIVEEQVRECYRCQIAKATQFCHNCEYTQQYCEDCAQLRGRRIKDKYHCIICLYLKNRAEEEHQHVTQQFYRMTTKNEQLYVPQIDEKVRFFFQGYEEFLVQNVTKLNTHVYKKNQSFRLLPHTQDVSLVNTPLCQIVSIEYCFPMKCNDSTNMKRTPGKGEKSPILMLLGLKPLEEGDIFWIFYLPGYEFLLLQHIYTQIKEKDLISRMMVNQLITLKDQELQIVQLGPIEDRFPESLWKMVKIRKTQGKRLRGNTKQIQRRVNIWKLSQQIQKISNQSDLNEKQAQRLVEQLKIWRDQTDSYFCIFQEYVEFEIYPKYRLEIPVGICLQTILARLQNNYYSNVHSLQLDIKMIYQNSLKFNGPPSVHEVTKKAEQLTSILFNLLNNQENPVPSNSKGTQQDSTNKKEKVMKQHDQFLQSFSNQFETRRKTRREQQKILRRRKQESSEYQEDQLSNQHYMDFQRSGVSTRNRNRNNRQTRQENQVKRITRSTQRH